MDTPIVVALIAAFASLIGLIITKEQKVSEFRQEWINKLRDDIAALIGHLSLLGNAWALVAPNYKNNKKVGDTFLKENLTTIKEIDLLISKSKLRLNPEKDKEMIAILNDVEDMTTAPDKLSNEDFEVNVNKLEAVSHKVFKTEWERVKDGEPIFRNVKCFMMAVVIFLLLFVVLKITNN